MREEFVAMASENLRLRGEVAEKDGLLAAACRKIAELEAELVGGRAVRVAEIAGHDEGIQLVKKWDVVARPLRTRRAALAVIQAKTVARCHANGPKISAFSR